MSINCIVVDDEPLAREGIVNYINNVQDLNVIASCKDAYEAMQVLRNGKPVDLIFLDIEMQYMNGIDFLKTIKPTQLIVLTTAYTKYAIEGFDLNVLDYLLKPISQKRFLQCIEKVKDYINYKSSDSSTEKNYLFIKNGEVLKKIFYSDILYVEASSNYFKIHTEKGNFLQYGTLYKIHQDLDQRIFKKIHRSYIVNINKISVYNSKIIHINGFQIPISNSINISEILNKDKP